MSVFEVRIYNEYSSKSYVFCDCPDEGHIFSLDQQLPQRPRGLCLGLDLEGLIEYDVHELIKAQDLALKPDVDVIIEPDLHSRLILEELEDDCKRVDALGLTLLRHL